MKDQVNCKQSMISFPVIETERLILRQLRKEDYLETKSRKSDHWYMWISQWDEGTL